MAGICDFSVGQQAHHVIDRPVIEVLNIDLGLIHVAAPTRGTQ
jgi:hypothetical protein